MTGAAQRRRVENSLAAVHAFPLPTWKEETMPENVYKVIELIGTSTDSWEKAAKVAVERAAKTLRDLRVAEIVQQDVQLNNGKVEAYRVKMKVSFKYEGQG
jgi:flavin-binding protein dodecin